MKKNKTQDNSIERLKVKVSNHREEVLKHKRRLKTSTEQYESVVKEQKKIIEDLFSNAPKLFYLYLAKKYQKIKERIKI